MIDEYFEIDKKTMYCRHNGINPGRTSLLFVHGLGDSGLSFEDPFEDNRFDGFNLVVPDLIGYGRSSGSGDPGDYSYDSQLQRLWALINELELKELIVVGHSMGGDLTTLLCASDKEKIIKKYINIEGDVTQYDLTISRAAVKAFERGNFEHWYENDFKQKLVYEKLGNDRSGRIYYASLAFCRKEAFLDNARELVRRNTSLEGKFKSEIGRIFVSLEIPKVFCYGTKSLARSSLRFLNENSIKTKGFEGIGHCPMTDCSAEFYDYVYQYITEDE